MHDVQPSRPINIDEFDWAMIGFTYGAAWLSITTSLFLLRPVLLDSTTTNDNIT